MKVAETTDSLLNEHRENCQIGLSYIKCSGVNFPETFPSGKFPANFPDILKQLSNATLAICSMTAMGHIS